MCKVIRCCSWRAWLPNVAGWLVIVSAASVVAFAYVVLRGAA